MELIFYRHVIVDGVDIDGDDRRMDGRLQRWLDRGWMVDTVSSASSSDNVYWMVILRRKFKNKEEHQDEIEYEAKFKERESLSDLELALEEYDEDKMF